MTKEIEVEDKISLPVKTMFRKNDSTSTIASKKYSKITPEVRTRLAYLIVQ
jgi:hypothetical protein